jgi:hypothetical protein
MRLHGFREVIRMSPTQRNKLQKKLERLGRKYNRARGPIEKARIMKTAKSVEKMLEK